MDSTIITKNGIKSVNLNRRKAIRENCLNCSGWSYADVAGCPFDKCSLYPFRLGRGKQDALARSKAIRSYCIWCMNGQSFEVGKCTSVHCPLHIFLRKNKSNFKIQEEVIENEKIS